jgi:hypothetical protein
LCADGTGPLRCGAIEADEEENEDEDDCMGW